MTSMYLRNHPQIVGPTARDRSRQNAAPTVAPKAVHHRVFNTPGVRMAARISRSTIGGKSISAHHTPMTRKFEWSSNIDTSNNKTGILEDTPVNVRPSLLC